jgi:ABC-type sugar transport system ATPase subunit
MIEATGILVRYNDRIVLDDVSLNVDVGERLALLGPSGSGKTTLLKVLSALQKPEEGQVVIDGVPCTRGAHNIGLVFQDLRLFPHLTARRNCLVGVRDPGADHALQSLAVKLALDHCLDRKPRHLSQGERQRVAIIRALVRKPKYLLLDEPTSALDSVGADNLVQVFQNVPEIGILFVTHDIRLAVSLGTTLKVLRDGHISAANLESYRQAIGRT